MQRRAGTQVGAVKTAAKLGFVSIH